MPESDERPIPPRVARWSWSGLALGLAVLGAIFGADRYFQWRHNRDADRSFQELRDTLEGCDRARSLLATLAPDDPPEIQDLAAQLRARVALNC